MNYCVLSAAFQQKNELLMSSKELENVIKSALSLPLDDRLWLLEELNKTMNNKILQRVVKLTSLDGKDLTQRALKTSEENGELSEAVLSCTGAAEYKKKTIQDVLEEACDVATCALSVAVESGFSIEQIEEGMHNSLDKWEHHLSPKNESK